MTCRNTDARSERAPFRPARTRDATLSRVESESYPRGYREKAVRLDLGRVESSGLLLEPADPVGAVVFAHGSGSSHLSPRNARVARSLAQNGILTLLFDLLSAEEALDRRRVFNIPLLSHRLGLATAWLRGRVPRAASIPLGYFGASTGAAAAIWSATEPDIEVAAIVSRGGRPDLAEVRMDSFQVPTLLIVGGEDLAVLAATRPLLRRMPRSELVVIPGATHLFEEPGALEQVSARATRWFLSCFEGWASDETLSA